MRQTVTTVCQSCRYLVSAPRYGTQTHVRAHAKILRAERCQSAGIIRQSGGLQCHHWRIQGRLGSIMLKTKTKRQPTLVILILVLSLRRINVSSSIIDRSLRSRMQMVDLRRVIFAEPIIDHDNKWGIKITVRNEIELKARGYLLLRTKLLPG